MSTRLAGFLALAALVLAGCGGPAEPVWAPEVEVQRYAYSNGDPPTLTLFTVVNKDLEAGRHSGLMINGRERIMFDPAGSFRLPQAPERNDVIHGMNDRVLAVYIDYHARETFDVHIQEVEVTPEVAEMVAQAVKAYGAVPKAQCSLSITRILSKTPGFEAIPVGYSPTRTMNAFGKIPGVTTRVVTDTDADDNHGVLFEAAQRPVPTVSDR